ncbi:hypothetical protein ARAM_006526 [Aspergillus rambellii]|uniref:SH3 domain-containing protein n=2 Tax=Aspergillus subgen. Nidulantes TaxID=2720870 RepID=A0A0F8UNJ1_9EURO|nr:hypothetical protein AOCH_006887 [Aspergillus ochraceoroseus]KKK21144.1 hypothetical protein ARAM_006526 [Aspergillus rambellii]
MTRPRILRADTLDLQDQHAPSAKDHSKSTVHTNMDNGIAPHQEQPLRHADHDPKAEVGPDSHETHLDTDGYCDDTYDINSDLGVHAREGDSGSGGEEADLTDGEADDLLDDDLMDKISSSPSIDDEDIDFEFVYALHNFVATVDGQANASKGDTMVLLDDSNSYWWLVRIVKDGSIGYLPAEHIETPTERLARLNKHRNVDLSATMLGDNSEKSKNPLKKAMRRRNAKTVTFTSPTYIEASDIEYSTEEELDDDASFNDDYASRDEDDLREEQNEDIVVEPLRPKSQRDKDTEEVQSTQDVEESEMTSPDKQRSSQEIFEQDSEVNVSRSRNGTVRNTDSFFRDDTVETKKISLTPNLLRDEVGLTSSEAKEGRVSLETIDTVSSNEKNKDDKKRKDKKSGMLSGLFKRKDKKSKTIDDEIEELEKHSSDLSRSSPTPKTSLESISSPESQTAKQTKPPRQSSKLQKQPTETMALATREMHQGSKTVAPVEEKQSAPREEHRPDQTIRQVVLEEVEEIAGSSRSRAYEADHQTMSNSARVPSPSKKPMSPTEGQNDMQDMADQLTSSQHSVTSPPQKFQPKPTEECQTRMFDSPVDVSPLECQSSPSIPALTTDVSPSGDHSASPDSPLFPTVATPDSKRTETSTTWSDSSLRAYLDDDNDIRDLFIIVHDNSNIPPAGPDHPITGSLFKEESKRLKEMTGQLDAMLSDWVNHRVRNSSR